MIFLKENVLLERAIKPDDIKPRLLGHWGTCPGLTLIYAHLNRIIAKDGLEMLYVVGPGACHPRSRVIDTFSYSSIQFRSPQATELRVSCRAFGSKILSPSLFPSIRVTRPASRT